MITCVFMLDFQVDSTLSFLDGFVSEALARGALPYLPKHLRHMNKPKQPSTTGIVKFVQLIVL